MALTKRDCDHLTFDPGGPAQQIAYDEDLPGFGIRAYASGVKSFVLRYRPSGARQPKFLTLGRYGILTVQQARELARAALVAARSGTDPAEERRRARLGETVQELGALYLSRHAKPRRKSWKEDERRLTKYIYPALGSRKLSELSRGDVARMHLRIGESAPVEANRVVQLLRLMLNLARDWGMLAEDAPNPADRIRAFQEKSRERWVTPEELPALVQAIHAEANPYVEAVLKLLLLTGTRRNELLTLRWADVDFQRAELRLPTTKNGAPRSVPLSPPAVEILRALPRIVGHPYVFPGHKARRPLVNINKSWRRVRARFWLASNPEAARELRARAVADAARGKKHAGKGSAAVEARLLALAQQAAKGEEDVRLHDLRRTVGSWLATSGTSAAIVGKVLGHRSLAATAIYSRISEEAARSALAEHGEKMGAALNPSPRTSSAS